jgi:hypothetical protein
MHVRCFNAIFLLFVKEPLLHTLNSKKIINRLIHLRFLLDKLLVWSHIYTYICQFKLVLISFEFARFVFWIRTWILLGAWVIGLPRKCLRGAELVVWLRRARGARASMDGVVPRHDMLGSRACRLATRAGSSIKSNEKKPKKVLVSATKCPLSVSRIPLFLCVFASPASFSRRSSVSANNIIFLLV